MKQVVKRFFEGGISVVLLFIAIGTLYTMVGSLYGWPSVTWNGMELNVYAPTNMEAEFHWNILLLAFLIGGTLAVVLHRRSAGSSEESQL
ncbi:hypothetical protein JIR001_14290 [Polycladomyces abyssicola]|uniref:Uncharacterized protein n=1 Tax=Polycladomyces abyssicola TaxID=1125966 RepID=A0A8D5ZNR4_9BACL|nr:hypothetical protein [Polycladomyces abyssicola]BCU81646.1 hypothetical protein JIR001_14290 [Polycladomyces abyssicola]